MVNMVALPLWIGTLMGSYQFCRFKLGLTSRRSRWEWLWQVRPSPPVRTVAAQEMVAGGLTVGATSVAMVTRFPVDPSSRASLLLLHAAAGMGAGVPSRQPMALSA